MLSNFAFFGSSDSLVVFSANKSSWLLSIFGFDSPLLRNLLISVLNSNSSNIARNLVSSGCSTLSSSKSSCIGTSVRIVARNFDILISSTAFSTFSRSLPLISSVCWSILSMLPNWLINLAAVFSPTPGQPGKLSAESPINANRSMTWAGVGMPYFSPTSFSPNIS